MVQPLNKKEINAKILEIIEYIQTTESYQNYLKARKILEQNEKIMNLIQDIKTLQKELVKNQSKKEELDLKIKEKLNILNTEPSYLEYQTYQDEINNLLIIFENKINKYFFDVFNQVVYE